MQTAVSDDFIRLLEQIDSKKLALVRLLLYLYSVRLESCSLPELQEEFDWFAKPERHLTQEIDLNAEKTKEEMTALLIDRHRRTLKGLSFQDLADMAALSAEISN